MNLPSSIDEFYKIIGEYYVSEIMKSRPDIHSPTQLMKELISGKSTPSENQLDINALIRQMMEQASITHNEQSNEINKLEPNTCSREFKDVFNQSNYKNGESNDFKDLKNQKLPECDKLDQHSWESNKQIDSKTQNLNQRKRDLKSEEKEQEDSNIISSLDLQINNRNDFIKEAWKINTESINKLENISASTNLEQVMKQSKIKRAPK